VQARGDDASGTISRTRSIGGSTTFSWDAQLAAMQASSLTGLDPEADPDLYRAVRDTKGITLYRVIEAMVGAGAFVGAIEEFGARSARRCASRRRSPRARRKATCGWYRPATRRSPRS
jgi:hypothetical protein